MLATKAKELLGTAHDHDFVFLYIGKFHHIADQVPPGARTGAEHYGIFHIFFYLVYKIRLRMAFQFAVLVEVFLVKGYEFVQDTYVEHQFDALGPGPRLEAERALGGHIGLDKGNGLAEQPFEVLLIRFEAYAAMDINSQVGPHIMNRVELIGLYDFFEYDLRPGRYAAKDTHIPLGCILDNEFDTLVPLGLARYFLTRFIEEIGQEPRHVLGADTAHIPFVIVAALAFGKRGTAAQHQYAFLKSMRRDIEIGHAVKLFEAYFFGRADHIAGNGDMLAGRLGSTGAQGKILDPAGPGYIFFAFQAAVPPLTEHAVIIMQGYFFPEFFFPIERFGQHFIETILFAESSILPPFEQVAQHPALVNTRRRDFNGKLFPDSERTGDEGSE